VVLERAVVGAIHDPTVARILAAASVPPHRSRSWKTATLDARFVTKAARILWRYARVAWLDERGEGVRWLEEKPHLQAVARRVPTQLMRPGPIERRELEYTRHGTVTCRAALTVDDGTMWGCGLAAKAHAHFLRALGRLIRRDPRAQRRHVILDNGSSHIAQATQAYVASHPRLRACYPPPHASWLNQAAWLLRAFSDKYLPRFASLSRQHLIDHLEARWPEDNRRVAHPFTWSWSCRDLYAWARKKATVICTKTYATLH
jgi:hypothetical protein